MVLLAQRPVNPPPSFQRLLKPPACIIHMPHVHTGFADMQVLGCAQRTSVQDFV